MAVLGFRAQGGPDDDEATHTVTASAGSSGQAVAQVLGGNVFGPNSGLGPVFNAAVTNNYYQAAPSSEAAASTLSEPPAMMTAKQTTPAAGTGSAFTTRWMPLSDLTGGGALLRLRDNHPDHPFGPTPHAPEPFIRIGVEIACDRRPAEWSTTSELRSAFRSFLASPHLASLRDSITAAPTGSTWQSTLGVGDHGLGAVLTRPGQKRGPVVASARLTFPASDDLWPHNSRCAEFTLTFQPLNTNGTARRLQLATMPAMVADLLRVPTCLNRFLTDDLGMSTRGAPATRAGVFLHHPEGLAHLVDTTEYTPVLGALSHTEFNGFTVADPDGHDSVGMAELLVRQLCDRPLGLIDFEDRLFPRRPSRTMTPDAAVHIDRSRQDRLQPMLRALMDHASTLLVVANEQGHLWVGDPVEARDARHQQRLSETAAGVAAIYTDLQMTSGTEAALRAHNDALLAADRHTRAWRTITHYPGTVPRSDVGRHLAELSDAVDRLRTASQQLLD
jgi:hypothetical protein